MLTVLSYGAGQDSFALLLKYIHSMEFRNIHVTGDFIVVMSDTGDEHPRTYKHVIHTQSLCREYNIPFFFITSDLGFHPKTWPSLRYQFEKNNTIGSKAFSKSCTDNLKIKPIYNFLADYVSKKYLYEMIGPERKESLKVFAQRYGKIKMIIGIARGEEKRIGSDDDIDLVWMKNSVSRIYPLVDMGMDRKDCQDYISACGEFVPPPSNCILCHWMSKQELLWLYRNMPDDYHAWVRYEQNKINREPDRKVNHGVFGSKRLGQVLEEAIKEFGHWTDDELHQYKMSHGHCVKSRY